MGVCKTVEDPESKLNFYLVEVEMKWHFIEIEEDGSRIG